MTCTNGWDESNCAVSEGEQFGPRNYTANLLTGIREGVKNSFTESVCKQGRGGGGGYPPNQGTPRIYKLLLLIMKTLFFLHSFLVLSQAISPRPTTLVTFLKALR